MNNPPVHFRPKARLMQLLGEQLIRDHRMALFELVKNSFDADAKSVSITFSNPNSKDASIKIVDSGFGMTPSIVSEVWLEPASNHKEIARKNNIRTPLGRLPVGEKGVGRFAVHKLGDHITMTTKAAGNKEVQVTINWKEFLEYEYLDQAPVTMTIGESSLFKDDDTGTIIEISDLHNKWARGDIRRLYRAVSAMTTPKFHNLPIANLEENTPDLKSKESEISIEVNDDIFDVNFNIVPECDWLNGIFDPDTAKDQAMYIYQFSIDENGFSSTYKFQPISAILKDFESILSPRTKEQTLEHSFEYFKLDRNGRKRNSKITVNELGVGPITGIIFGFDLDKQVSARYIPDITGLTKFLKEQGGIRVYRDGMRVYDYGEQGNDWLGLDHRRVQSPSRKVSNQLLMGQIHLDLKYSQNLKEKTNREGFIENEAYQELRYAILCALNQFEIERNKDKKILRSCFNIPKSTEKSLHKVTTEEAIENLSKKSIEMGYDKELGPLIKQVSETYKETRNTLMSAAGAGLGLVTVFHEIERGVRGLDRAIEFQAPLDKLVSMSKHLVETLQGAAYMVTNKNMENVNASKLVKYALLSQSTRFEFHNIKFLNGFENSLNLDFEVKGIRRMFTATLVNLIDNAIHWVKINRESDEIPGHIWIGPSHDLEGPAIVVADSGGGFEDPPEDIIQPFFTRRMEGMGIGLYYADMVMKSHKGRLAFPNNGDISIPKVCKGAVVSLVFNSKGMI
ncbi:ATP-binding protein [Amphritea pacifica]|uniref:ATP-binding protein n=1 Tax=Amphritea pacifica TaxID=2811233 RepID=UPI0019652C78|nr:ATP-binding protein [Amphritea pacifica]MBN1007007.1 ATP-binding protein [Amphritea pacifica]